MSGRSGRVRPLLAASALVASLALASCSAPAASSPSTGARARELPAGISVSVTQNRTDFAIRRLELSIANETAQVLTVTSAEFVSSQFVGPATWAKDATTIRPGSTANLPVLLPDADCETDDPVAAVLLDLRLGDDDPIAASITPEDTYDRLPALRAEDCLTAAVLHRAALSADTLPRRVTVGGRDAAEVDIAIEPTGEPGIVVIDEAIGTTLFALTDPVSGAVLPSVIVARAVSAEDAASTLTLTVVPNRCDAHAVAEDKRGTVFPLRVTVDGDPSGIVSVAASAAVKDALYDYLAAACAEG